MSTVGPEGSETGGEEETLQDRVQHIVNNDILVVGAPPWLKVSIDVDVDMGDGEMRKRKVTIAVSNKPEGRTILCQSSAPGTAPFEDVEGIYYKLTPSGDFECYVGKYAYDTGDVGSLLGSGEEAGIEMFGLMELYHLKVEEGRRKIAEQSSKES